MKIRELNAAEIDIVSGAGRNWCLSETYNDFIKGIDSFKEMALSADNTKDWRYVAATNEKVKGGLEAFLVDFGLGGKETTAYWAKEYAA